MSTATGYDRVYEFAPQFGKYQLVVFILAYIASATIYGNVAKIYRPILSSAQKFFYKFFQAFSRNFLYVFSRIFFRFFLEISFRFFSRKFFFGFSQKFFLGFFLEIFLGFFQNFFQVFSTIFFIKLVRQGLFKTYITSTYNRRFRLKKNSFR